MRFIKADVNSEDKATFNQKMNCVKLCQSGLFCKISGRSDFSVGESESLTRADF